MMIPSRAGSCSLDLLARHERNGVGRLTSRRENRACGITERFPLSG
jgi:hypothetical protein